VSFCWHKYGNGHPIERGGIWNHTLMIRIRKVCSKCGKVKEYWTAAGYVP
jgi:hypothetical protein